MMEKDTPFLVRKAVANLENKKNEKEAADSVNAQTYKTAVKLTEFIQSFIPDPENSEDHYFNTSVDVRFDFPFAEINKTEIQLTTSPNYPRIIPEEKRSSYNTMANFEIDITGLGKIKVSDHSSRMTFTPDGKEDAQLSQEMLNGLNELIESLDKEIKDKAIRPFVFKPSPYARKGELLNTLAAEARRDRQ
jgi:hypothetical protein